MSSTPSPEQPLLDSAHLAEIASLEPFKPGLRRQMLKLFEESARNCLIQSHDSIGAHDVTALRLAAHRLKGSAISLGAARLQTLAATLEAAAESGCVESTPVLLEQAEAVLEQTLRAYRGWLSE